jgi:toxin ParE1/3/4
MSILWSPLALRQVREIAAFIAQDDPVAAADWARGLFARVAAQLRQPRSGRTVPEFGRLDLRELIHGAYRVIYLVEDARSAVLLVRHAKRLLGPEDLEP